MISPRRAALSLLLFALACLWHLRPSAAQAPPPAPAAAAAAPRDGARDFDWNLGAWKTHVRRRKNPLSGSTTWIEYDGTHIVRPVWNGRANLGELEVDGPTGHVEGLSLRLYNAQSRQWSLNFAGSRDGSIGVPMVGEFKDGRGEFVDQETYNGRAVLVRSVWSDITATSCRQEQSFSADGGKTWEVNWISVDTRMPAAAAAAAAARPDGAAAALARAK